MYLTGQESSSTYQIKFLEINKENSDYAVAMLDDDKLVFTSAANANSSNKRNHNPRKELFIGDIDFDGEILNVKPVTNKENNKFNTTGIAYTNDLKTVYFSRNKYVRKSSKQELDKNKRLELYKANVDSEGNWTNIEKLPFNDDKFSTGYPTLSKDNTKLYFVSDRLPSMGKTDIFVVDVLKNGTFGVPRNLGKKINTSGEETTPYLSNNNILYFSSDGHQGNGNLDIFAIDITHNLSTEIHHLESPINSINDDFAYIINQDTNRGFFTSNRLQGENNNDLYSFTLKKEKPVEECFITVDGFVKDKDSQELLKGTTVDLLDLNGALIQSVTTSDDGAYIFNVACSNEYKLSATNDDYKNEIKQIEILEQNYHRSLHTNMNLTKLYKDIVEHKNSEVKKDNINITSINAIHFDFDKSNLRSNDLPELDKIVKIMKDNTNIKVEAAAYTDSRGTHAYNKLLSQRRAKATVDYIISKGIDANRIIGKGYGEEKLINHCVDGVDCSEEAHEKNRRTEFVILNGVAANGQDEYDKKNKDPVLNTKKTSTYNNKEVETASNKSIKKEKVITVNNTQKPLEKNDKTVKSISSKSEEINKDLVINSKKQEINKTKVIEESPKKSIEEQKELAINNKKIVTNEVATVKRPRTDNKAENYIDDQKDKVIDKLIVLEEKFEKASTKDSNLTASFISEKNKITELKNEVIKSNVIGWANIINYNNQIISFNKTYKKLMQNVVENQETTNNDKIEKSNETKQLYKKTIEGESVSSTNKKVLPKKQNNNLDVKNVQVIAMKKNSKGKYAETSSAKKTDLIKVSFKLLHNNKVKPGKKEAYFVLQNPKGKVTNAKGVFNSKNTKKMKKYTDYTLIDYNHNDVDIIMFVDRKGYEYEKGTYPAKLFLDGELVAESNLNLSGGL